MIAVQMELLKVEGEMSFSRNAVGSRGERWAYNALQASGYDVSFTRLHEKRGDLRAVSPDGEVKLIEVKTARQGKDNKWRFLLKGNGQDYRHADIVLCLCVLKSGTVVPFVIPVDAIDQAQICISSFPLDYAGKWAQYRQRGQIRL